MNILSTQYTLKFKSLDIYVAGCKGNPHCKNCHNPESWSFNQGVAYGEDYFKNIKAKTLAFNNMIDNIMIFGGEPLDQNHEELILMLKDLTSLNKTIWLFTRYEFHEIPEEIRKLCRYIKCGRYIEELKSQNNIQYGVKLATSNQRIYSMDN